MRRISTTILFALVALHSGPASAQIPSRNLDLKSHWNEYPTPTSQFGSAYASCWSYVDSDSEFAIIGTYQGTAIYNVTDPVNSYRVAFIGGPVSAWREMKSYRNWIYVVTENRDTPNPGIQIIRMSKPPVLAATYTTNFITSHTVSVDTARALLFCNGTRDVNGFATGMRVLSLANPEAPVQVGWWPGGSVPVSSTNYVHDSAPIGNRLYAASIYVGRERVIDTTNPALPTEITSWTYPGTAFTHNSWPDASGNYLYVTDEVNGQPLKVFNISNLGSPQLVYKYTPNAQAIVHNAHVQGNELYLANYTEGIRVMDLSDPAHPAEYGWADSYPGTSGSYYGVWGVCPYFPSGTVIASDMQTGLYVYRPVRNYGILRVKVVNAATMLPLDSIRVRLPTLGDSLITSSDGIVQFAPGPGSHTVEIKQFGYEDASATRVVSVGSRDSVTLALVAKPTAHYMGTVREAVPLTPLNDAEVDLAYSPVQQRTDSIGGYHVHVPEDFYRVEVRRPGYIPLIIERSLAAGTTMQDFRLYPTSTWDNLETGTGWVVGAAGDNATGGIWTRGEPTGTGLVSTPSSQTRGEIEGAAARDPLPWIWPEHEGESPAAAPPGTVQPEFDRSPPPYTLCFVTGQDAVNPANPDLADVDGGKTTLTSPTLDLTDMEEPTIAYWRWFYSNGDASDWMAVSISNDDGANWVPVDTTRGFHNRWEEVAIPVANYVAPTNQMKVRFVVADLGYASIVEGAIDDLATYDNAMPRVKVPGTPGSERLAFGAPWPNPAEAEVSIELVVPRATSSLEVEVLDLLGRRVRMLHRGRADAGAMTLRWNGADDRGNASPAGLYFARARSAGEATVARFVRMR